MRTLIVFILSCYIFSLRAAAQVCTGSLGKPVINIDFGMGQNPGSPLNSGITSYQYTSQQCYDDGFYSIRNAVGNCPLSNWHQLNSDHTRNGAGYFMMVNAAVPGAVIYSDTAKNLCGNTTYEFSAWLLNLNKSVTCGGNPMKPNITFSVSTLTDTVLQTYNTGDIPVTAIPEWKPFGFLFTTPANTGDLIFILYNNAPGGCGNDFALDDINFKPCGPLLALLVDGNASQSNSFCTGTAASFDLSCNVSGNINNPAYQWQQSTDSLNFTDIAGANGINYVLNFPANATSGKYYYRMRLLQNGQSINCSVYSDPVVFRIDPLPTGSIVSNNPVCENTTLHLSLTTATLDFWTLPSGQIISQATLSLQNMNQGMAGKYYANLKSNYGCVRKDSISIIINPAPSVSVSFSDSTICSGTAVDLHASGADDYLWSPSQYLNDVTVAEPVATTIDSTRFMVIGTNAFSCADTAYIKINAIKKPIVNAGPDRVVITGQSIPLHAFIQGDFSSFKWMPSAFIDNIFSLDPMVNPVTESEFILSADALRGCGTSFDSTIVRVFNDLYIPNSFTPNNDGKNDRWRISALDAFSGISVIVFNRNGRAVFETKNILQSWDGTFKGVPLAAGNYVYMITIPGRQPLRGNLLLVR